MISSFLFARIVVNKTSSRKGGCLTGIGRGSGEGVGGVLVSLFRIWTDLGFFATDQTVFFYCYLLQKCHNCNNKN